MRQDRDMKIGAFEVDEPVPVLRNPTVISMLRPWLDAGNVGTLVLEALERHLETKEFARLARPGTFFDLTRYRPTVHYVGDQRVYTVPNCTISYIKQPQEPDLVLLHLLEPHAFAEDYIEAILEFLKTINAKGLCRIGAMYDAVPHTRPLPVSNFARGQQVGAEPPSQRRYEGPTSIMNLLTEGAEKLGMEMGSLMVRLPYYAQLEDDYTGVARLLEVLCDLYQIPHTVLNWERAREQYRNIDAQIEGNPGVRALVKRLEAEYDAQTPPAAPESPLSPEIERFLREIDRRLEDSEK